MTKLNDAGRSSTSPPFLMPDDRLPPALRDLLIEADGCVTNGFYTGGTACAQRAVEVLLRNEKTEGSTHEARVRSLVEKTPGLPQILVTVLTQLGDVSGRDTAKLTANTLNLLIATLKAVVYEIYVIGPERTERLQYIRRLLDATERKPVPSAATSSAVASSAA